MGQHRSIRFSDGHKWAPKIGGSHDDFAATMGQLGAEGWEIAGIAAWGPQNNLAWLMLKRPLEAG